MDKSISMVSTDAWMLSKPEERRGYYGRMMASAVLYGALVLRYSDDNPPQSDEDLQAEVRRLSILVGAYAMDVTPEHFESQYMDSQ